MGVILLIVGVALAWLAAGFFASGHADIRKGRMIIGICIAIVAAALFYAGGQMLEANVGSFRIDPLYRAIIAAIAFFGGVWFFATGRRDYSSFRTAAGVIMIIGAIAIGPGGAGTGYCGTGPTSYEC